MSRTRTTALPVVLAILSLPLAHPAAAAFQPFAAARNLGAVDGPRQIAVADIDRDGDPDVAVVADSGDELIWLENGAGDGSTWFAHQIAPAFVNPKAAELADLDRDGDLDLITASPSEPADLSWWESSNGGLTWTHHQIDSVFGLQVWDVAAIDADHDGDLDVVAADYGRDEVIVYTNDDGVGGAWSSHTLDNDLGDVRAVFPVEDLDGDGHMDLIAAGSGHDEITVYLGASSGTAATAHPLSTTFDGASGALLVDLDRDGDLDAVGSALTADEIRWWTNTGGLPSTWPSSPIDTTANGARNLVAEDLDHDGDLDLLAPLTFDNELAWWENLSGDASTWARHTVGTGLGLADHALPVDVDGDGDLDVVASGWLDDVVVWFENESGPAGTPFFTPHTIGGLTGGAAAIQVADLNRDGHPDVVAGSPGADLVGWFRNDGDAAAWTLSAIDAPALDPMDLDVADLDRDGDLDVIAALAGSDEVVWWEDTPGGWVRATLWADVLGASGVAVADFDADGDRDVAAAAAEDWTGWIANMSGDATTVTTDGFSIRDGANQVGIADMNGDGWIDFYTAASADSDVTFFENQLEDDLNSDFISRVLLSFFDGARDVAAGDMDRDGDLDLVAVAAPIDAVHWWSNTGANVFGWEESTIATSLDGATSVEVADLDRDGDLDVVAAGEGGDIRWWANHGGTWVEHVAATGLTDLDTLALADLDRDGDLDLITDDGNTLVWWESRTQELFDDGFESGGLERWSQVQP